MSEDYQELEEQSISVVQGDAPEAKPVVNENSAEAIKQRRWVVCFAPNSRFMMFFLFLFLFF
jgi:hypothetical protein